MRPETHFAQAGGLSIAYQVVGDGPFDLVFVRWTAGEWRLWAVEGG